jgi:hypothetical protein
MRTRTLFSNLGRLTLAATVLLLSSACGGELLRTGRSPVYLVVTGIETEQGGGTAQASSFLLSDVRLADGSVFNDNVTVTLSVVPKNPTVATTAINAVTLTRYRVRFRRADGRNTPGVDVPYGFDGALNSTISAGSSQGVAFEIVRHQMKLEPPLKNLAGFNDAGARSISGLGFLSTIAEITIWGRDQNGNEVTVTTSVDVHFADLADS